MDTKYSLSHKKYYETKKEEINARRREYARQYSKTYYETHKDEINKKRKSTNPVGRPKKSAETPQKMDEVVPI